MSVTIYHNPRCSKSRQTLQLLQDKGVEPEIIEYLKTPPTAPELDDILQKLAIEPRDLMRRKEGAYKENGLDDDGLSREQLIAGMAQYPILIERPIVLANGKAALGRPPEEVLKSSRGSGGRLFRQAEFFGHRVTHPELLRLAGDGHRQLVAEAHIARHLVVGDLALARRPLSPPPSRFRRVSARSRRRSPRRT